VSTEAPRHDRPRPSALPASETLPALVTDDTTATEWCEKRRPELEALLRHYVYGYAPDPPRIETTVDDRGLLCDGTIRLREVSIGYPERPAAPTIELAVFGPPKGSAPTIVGLNYRGNHALVADETVTATEGGKAYGADERGAASDSWCVAGLVERGYALATFQQADVAPDRDTTDAGVLPHFEPPGPAIAAWGTLAVWAWGLQRVADALVDAPFAEELIVTGHSRRGKAALLAGATDERFAMVAPHQSGTGGMTLSRGNGQETVADITATFPHWFADTFHAFAGRPERLPVDQHALAALVAPRPLLDTEGTRDYWSNPGLALDTVRAAAPVYDLLGETGTVDDGVLYEAPITRETAGRLVQYRRETAHTMEWGYWDAICDVADLHL
jgi:hypothetical protein